MTCWCRLRFWVLPLTQKGCSAARVNSVRMLLSVGSVGSNALNDPENKKHATSPPRDDRARC